MNGIVWEDHSVQTLSRSPSSEHKKGFGQSPLIAPFKIAESFKLHESQEQADAPSSYQTPQNADSLDCCVFCVQNVTTFYNISSEFNLQVKAKKKATIFFLNKNPTLLVLLDFSPFF